MVIGILALQGDFREHLESLKRYKVKALEVRTKEDLKKVDGLILPGGESTAIAKQLVSTGLDEAICERVKKKMPVWGTCAGAILLAKNVVSPVPLSTQLRLIDVTIERNSYGRQTESFKASLSLHGKAFDGYFIRAPRITKVGKGVKVLMKWKGDPVLLQSGSVLISTFHSELRHPNLVLEYFLNGFK